MRRLKIALHNGAYATLRRSCATSQDTKYGFNTRRRHGNGAAVTACNSGAFAKTLDESGKYRQHGAMRGLICAARIRNFLGEREAQKRKNPPWRGGHCRRGREIRVPDSHEFPPPSSLSQAETAFLLMGAFAPIFSLFPWRVASATRRRGHVFCSINSESSTPPPRQAVHGRTAIAHRQERPRPRDVSGGGCPPQG